MLMHGEAWELEHPFEYPLDVLPEDHKYDTARLDRYGGHDEHHEESEKSEKSEKSGEESNEDWKDEQHNGESGHEQLAALIQTLQGGNGPEDELVNQLVSIEDPELQQNIINFLMHIAHALTQESEYDSSVTGEALLAFEAQENQEFYFTLVADLEAYAQEEGHDHGIIEDSEFVFWRGEGVYHQLKAHHENLVAAETAI